MTCDVTLRDVTDEDLPVLFEHQRDPEASRMAAFPPRDRDAFAAHWERILGDDSNVTKAILVDGQLAGNAVCFGPADRRQVGYWIGREHWGRGIATRALGLLLDCVRERPLYAHVAQHNRASIRVLEKCGFTVCGEGRTSSDRGGDPVEELVFRLGKVRPRSGRTKAAGRRATSGSETSRTRSSLPRTGRRR